MGLIEVSIVHVKTECFFDYIKMIDQGVEIMKKHGAEPINQYFVEAGGAPEIVYIVRYESFDQRSKIMEGQMKDPGFHAYFKKASNCILRVQNYVCVANPEIGLNKPKSHNSKKMLEMFKVSDPTQVGCHMKEMLKFYHDKMGENAPKPLALLHPLFFTQQCVIVMFECPDNMDAALKSYGEIMGDAHNWPKIKAAHNMFNVQSVRLLNPLCNLKTQ